MFITKEKALSALDQYEEQIKLSVPEISKQDEILKSIEGIKREIKLSYLLESKKDLEVTEGVIIALFLRIANVLEPQNHINEVKEISRILIKELLLKQENEPEYAYSCRRYFQKGTTEYEKRVARRQFKLLHEDDESLLLDAAILHDIGLPYLGENLKGATEISLSQDEVHGKKGGELLKSFGTPKLIKLGEICQHHHENFDGTGVLGLKGSEVTILTRIIRIADYFHNFIMKRMIDINFKNARYAFADEIGRKLDPLIARIITDKDNFEAISTNVYSEDIKQMKIAIEAVKRNLMYDLDDIKNKLKTLGYKGGENIGDFIKKTDEKINNLKEKVRELNEEIKKIDQEKRYLDEILMETSEDTRRGKNIPGIIHNTKQPLSSIGAIVGTLKMNIIFSNLSDKEKSTFIEGLEAIKKCNKETSNNLDALRQRSSLNKKEKQEAVSYKLINKNIEGELLHKKGKYGAKIINEFKNEEDVDFFVNQYNFEQVIINIVDNAIDAGSEQNIENIKIKITASMDKDYSYLEIEDNCGGIPNSIIGKIFEENFTTKESGKGSGIGLSSAKRVIKEEHGGEIIVENIEKGAKFTIKIPRKEIKGYCPVISYRDGN